MPEAAGRWNIHHSRNDETEAVKMRESIHKYFKVGTIQWMSYPKRDAMESLKAICRDDYFDAIELKGYGEKNEEAKALIEQSHLKVCYGAQPRLLGPKLNPNAIDRHSRAAGLPACAEAGGLFLRRESPGALHGGHAPSR